MSTKRIIAFLLAALLMYAGMVKLMNPTLFQTQLSKSPLIPSGIIPFLAYALPLSEVAVAFLLFTDKYLKFALHYAFALMAFFSVYLIVLYTAFPKQDLPCSCGGILGYMSYEVHIVFNLCFTLLAGIGVFINEQALERHART